MPVDDAQFKLAMSHFASGVTIVTAHQDPDNDRLLDWSALAQAGTTLVVLMGAARARSISERLIAGGMRADMPVAIVTSATCDDQCIERLPLDRLGREPVRNPSVIVIGEVAARDVLRDVPELPALVATAAQTEGIL